MAADCKKVRLGALKERQDDSLENHGDTGYSSIMKQFAVLLLILSCASGCTGVVNTNDPSSPPSTKAPAIQEKVITLPQPSQVSLIPALCMEIGLWLNFEIPSNDDKLKIIGCQQDNSSRRALMFQVYGNELKMLWAQELDAKALKMVELLETI